MLHILSSFGTPSIIIGLMLWVNKKKGRFVFYPSLVFSIVWIVVICFTISFSDRNLSQKIEIQIALLWGVIFLSLVILSLQVGTPPKDQKPIDTLIAKNIKVLEFSLLICVIFRFIQIVYNFSVIQRLGGSMLSIFYESQSLRAHYLLRDMLFVEKIFQNLLNYFSELGVLLSSLFFFSRKKKNKFFLVIALSLLNSISTFSKLAFIVDLCFVISVLFLYINNFTSRKQSKSQIIANKRRTKIVFLVLIILGIFLLFIAGFQRGYSKQESVIDGIDNVVISKAIAYMITPYMAFQVLLDSDFNYSWGARTFRPIARFFRISFQNFGNIDVGLDETAVYSILGVLYADFGYIGAIIFLIIFLAFADYIFLVTYRKFSITKLGLYSIINAVIILSFFSWVPGTITFFWVFPVFLLVFEKIFIKY